MYNVMYNVIYIAHCNLFPILVPVADLQGQFPHFFLTNPYMCKNLKNKAHTANDASS